MIFSTYIRGAQRINDNAFSDPLVKNLTTLALMTEEQNVILSNRFVFYLSPA